MADQSKERLMEHSYDGIQEYDNPMPRWWVIIFWATIVFAVLYWFNVPGIGTGKGRIAAYEADMARARARQAETRLAGGGGAGPEQLAALAANPAAVEAARQLFTQNCAACHRADAGGLIGPNLTDEYWIHGGAAVDIRKTIDEGVLAKGMPPWGKVFKPEQVDALAAYVTTLRGTNPPNPRPAEGTRVAP